MVFGSDHRVIELTDQVRAERLARHPNAKAVRRRRDKKIMRIQLTELSDDRRLIVHRGNPRRYSHDHESESNPRGVWTMRRLGSTDPAAEQYVREIYRAAVVDNVVEFPGPAIKERKAA
jgi:prolyl oligopeptidase PreP (S9A serine peptidase family)